MPGASGSLLSMETARFGRWLGKVSERSLVSGVTILQEAALEALGMIIEGTPVDTGRARAGWSASAERFGISTRADEGPNSDKAEQEKGRQESEHNERLSGPRPYIEMVNKVPHAVMLEYGWSRQAPHGMVRVALRKIRRAFKASVLAGIKKAGR